MRKLVVHMQTTMDSRIATADGVFWEPFPWGDEETAYVNDFFRRADTWVMGRHIYEAVTPWWDLVAAGQVPADVPDLPPAMRELGEIYAGLTVMAVSSTREATPERPVLSGDVAGALARMKEADGKDIVLSGGPGLLAPLAAVPGLIDEWLLAVHPVVLGAGPRLLDGLTGDLPLRLLSAKAFDGGAVVLRYAPAQVSRTYASTPEKPRGAAS